MGGRVRGVLQAKASLSKPTALGNALQGAEGERGEQRERGMLTVNGERLSGTYGI